MAMLDLTGKRFGALVALRPVPLREPSNGAIRWQCVCDCGNYHVANSNNLKFGQVRSCGCSRYKAR